MISGPTTSHLVVLDGAQEPVCLTSSPGDSDVHGSLATF